MSPRRIALGVCALPLVFAAVAMAAALPKRHAQYFYVKRGTFSITLTTSKSAHDILASKPAGVSSVLVVCPRTSTGGVNEVQAGFPGVELKLIKGRYGFSLKYTEKSADLTTISPVFGHITHLRATVNVSGTVRSSRLIVGTVSVSAAGCSLPKTKYRATHG